MNRRRAAALALATLIAPLTLHAQTPSPVSSRRLTLTAETDGVRTTLDLRIDGQRVDGTVEEPGLRLALVGTLDGQRLEGRLQEPATRLTLVRLSGRLLADRLEATLTPVASTSAPAAMVFTREGSTARRSTTSSPGAAAPMASAGALDPRLVGRWVHQSMINSSGGAGGFASFTTERTLEFGGDGQVRQWVLSVGGGGQWSSNSGRELEFAGRWQVRGAEIWVQAQGGSAFERAGSYRFSGNYLVTEGSGGRRIWQR